MRHKRLIGCLVIGGALLSVQCWAGAFDPVVTGARANGMGGAFTAVADDPTATYWNPAGLAGVKRPSIVFSHCDIETLGLLSHDYLVYAQPFVFDNVIAIGWTRLGTTANVTFLNYSENTITIAYQQPITSRISAGLNMKIYQVQYSSAAGGFGIDLGGRYQVLPEIAVAFIYENLNEPRIEWLTGALDKLPSNLRLGLAGYPVPDVVIALDVDRLLETHPQFHGGVEYWFFSKMLALRAGVTHWPRENKFMPSAGLSFRLAFLELAYAYASHFDLDGNHVISLQWGF